MDESNNQNKPWPEELEFDARFMASDGRPIEHRGKTLIMADRLPARLGQRFEVTIERTRSRFYQGVGLQEGVKVFGERAKRVVIWEYFSLPPEARATQRAALPFSFEVECRNRRGELLIYNIAEHQGRQIWWSGGSAMWREELPNGWRYHCNDFQFNDDFDDLVFSVRW